MPAKIDLTGVKFNHLTIIKELGRGKVICKCDCEKETILECYKKNVKNGVQKSCGCTNKNRKIDNLEGRTFGNWVVLKEVGYGLVRCQCQCNNKTERDLYKKALINGETKSCGCMRSENNFKAKEEYLGKYAGKQFNEFKAIRIINGTSKYLCRCSCGKEKEVYITHLINGSAKSCGHELEEIVGKQFGNWIVKKRLKNNKLLCDCLCGNAVGRVLYKSTLIYGRTNSCGCLQRKLTRETMLKNYGDICTLKIDKPREKWQIDTISSKYTLEKYISNLENKPTIKDLSFMLGVNRATISRYLNEYDLSYLVKKESSYLEDSIYNYINSIYSGRIDRQVNCLDNSNLEIDIYLPELNVAFEVNGIYWHSNIFKDKYYHQTKSLLALNKGVRLINIFESEWIKDNNKIKSLIKNAIHNNKRVYARDLMVKEVGNSIVYKFCEDNHMQGGINSSYNIVLADKDDNILGVMTFGKSRYSSEDIEMYRMCFLDGHRIIGGASKMLKYFINKYNPKSIVTYCDISKFDGKSYINMGFKPIKVTEPNYIWVNNKYDVLSRYQTQRHKLYELGFKDKNLSEDDIMKQSGYFKVYNSGNIKFVLNREEN